MYCKKCCKHKSNWDNLDLICDDCIVNKQIKVVILVLLLFVLFFLNSCSKKLLKQSPPLAVENRFYKFEKDVGVISHNRCEKAKGADRKCIKTFTDINTMWDIFYPGHIIIKKDMVFK